MCHHRHYSLSNGDLVQRYRELAEVVIGERALGVGRLIERESLRHFDVEGGGIDQAINWFERRILILPVIRLHGDAGTIFPRQLNTVRIGGSSTATQRCYAFLHAHTTVEQDGAGSRAALASESRLRGGGSISRQAPAQNPAHLVTIGR